MIALIACIIAVILACILIFGSEYPGWGVVLLVASVGMLVLVISLWCGPQPVSRVESHPLLPLIDRQYVLQWPVEDTLNICPTVDGTYEGMMVMFIINVGGVSNHMMMPANRVQFRELRFPDEPHLTIEKLSAGPNAMWGCPAWREKYVLYLPPQHRAIRIGE